MKGKGGIWIWVRDGTCGPEVRWCLYDLPDDGKPLFMKTSRMPHAHALPPPHSSFGRW